MKKILLERKFFQPITALSTVNNPNESDKISPKNQQNGLSNGIILQLYYSIHHKTTRLSLY